MSERELDSSIIDYIETETPKNYVIINKDRK